MKKLILLNEVREKKVKDKDKLLTFNKSKNVKEDYNKSFLTFKEKFDYFNNKEEFSCSKQEKNLNKIIERIFLLNNKKPMIELINSIYNDGLSMDTKIKYVKENKNNNEVINLKDISYNIRILAEDEYKKFEYKIQFQTKDDQNIAIIISKIELFNNNNIISFDIKKREYSDTRDRFKENYNECIIMLNSNIVVPDVYEIKSDIEGEDKEYKINIIKSWKYDFKQLFEENMYLLFPLKALDLKKRLSIMNDDPILRGSIKDEIFRFFKDMNKYLKKGLDINLITDKDINELNLITFDLLNHFVKDKNSVLSDLKRDIEATLRDIV